MATTGKFDRSGPEPRTSLVKEKYGRLTVARWAGRRGGQNYWHCRCICGNKTIVQTGNFERTFSCGCLKAERLRDVESKGYRTLRGAQWNNILSCAHRRGLSVKVTVREAYNLMLKQKHKCAVTGLALQFWPVGKNKGTASLDRIDNSRGYVLDNVQWVHRDVNIMKRSLSMEQFVSICRLVVVRADTLKLKSGF